ncbi:fimbrial protein [Enterobacter cancerogenus]|uniref:fimbrial protein n=1 Tax=Enterobacter cancerogenus TaxID=69218 RepID=UPI001F1ACE00|nr:fimbrial protein [Enterobacter cancerogenus]
MNKGIIMKFTSFLLAVGLLGISGISQAAQECKFTSNDPLLIMSPPPVTIVPLPVDAAVHPTLIASGIIMETVPQLRSKCEMGKHGLDVFQLTDPALQTNAEFEGKTLFGTNVPGIFYTLGFYPDGNGVTAWFPVRSGGQFVRTGDTHGSTNIVDEKTWHVRMDFYQTNAFEGVPSNVNFLTFGPGTIGQIVLGNPDSDTDDHPRPQVSISQISLDIVANRPTCGIHAPTNVDLGEWTPREVENGLTTEVKFKVSGTCANTGILYGTLKSNHATSDGNYILNELSGTSEWTPANGVGVQITTPFRSKINSSFKEAIVVFDDKYATTSFEVEYKAQLLKYSDEPVTVGPFGSNLIMQFTYE